jgi:hypothetical protein
VDVAQLLEPVLTGAIRDTNFFNGRILTADDLRTMQVASRLQDAQLGRVLGDGVAFGLEVRLSRTTTSTAQRPVVRVTKGLAINRRGEVLEVVNDLDLALIRDAQVETIPSGAFVECPPPRPETTLTNFGLYVLTVQPAYQLEGRAPMTELGTEGIGGACGSRYAVAGVKFRLVRLELGTDTDSSTLRGRLVQLATELDAQLGLLTGTVLPSSVASLVSRLRNGVAHLCFGSETFKAFVTDPFGSIDRGASPAMTYGALDRLRDAAVLTTCEVPLGLVYWTAAGVQFVDQWAVRRPTIPLSVSGSCPIADTRRMKEALASVLQFEEHVAGLMTAGVSAAAAVRAVDSFFYLPPMGILPIGGSAGFGGFIPETFFQMRTVREPYYIEGAIAPSMFAAALAYPPIDLRDDDMIWVYRVRENMQTLETSGAGQAQPVLVFTNGHVPFRGGAHFNLAHWDYANFV